MKLGHYVVYGLMLIAFIVYACINYKYNGKGKKENKSKGR